MFPLVFHQVFEKLAIFGGKIANCSKKLAKTGRILLRNIIFHFSYPKSSETLSSFLDLSVPLDKPTRVGPRSPPKIPEDATSMYL